MSSTFRRSREFNDNGSFHRGHPIPGVVIDNNRMFPDFYQSVMLKAFKVSPTINGITLGPSASIDSVEQDINESISNQIPDRTSTPIKKNQRLSEMVLRRPRKPMKFFEINSSSQLERKTLISEMANKTQRDGDKKVSELEIAVKNKDEKLHNDLSQKFSKMRFHHDTKKRIAEEELLKKYVCPIVNSDNEIEQVTDIKVIERSEKVKQNVEDAKRKSAALHEQKRNFDVLSKWFKEYSAEYTKVVETLNKCRDSKTLQEAAAPFFRQLEKDAEVTDSLRAKLNSYNLSSNDLINAQKVLTNLRVISNALEIETNLINDALDAKEKKEAEDKIKKEAEEKNPAEIDAGAETPTFLDMESLNKFLRYTQHLSEVHRNLEPFLNDTNFSQFRFDLQKSVTLPVNAISPVSSAHMMDKYRKLHNLLSGKGNEPGKTAPDAHPLGVLFVKDLLAKLFVRQGEMSGSSKPESVFALASILVNLWVDFLDFGDLVLAHIYKRCPYLAPVYLPQVEGQTDEDYYRSLGYIISKGEIEKQDMFLKRMKGLMRLFATVLITKPRNINSANPLGLKEGWRWLAATLNLEPNPDICAVLILELLEIAGHDLLQVYRGQMRKVLAYLMSEYFTRLDQVTASISRGPLTRLETFLAKAAKTGNIPEPAQRLSQSFW